MPRNKLLPRRPCIGCQLRQQQLDHLQQEQVVFSDVIDVFLTVYKEYEDVLIYDPSHRIYQHFVKDPDVYEMVTVKENTYSLQQFSSFLKELLTQTLDEKTFHLYESWDALYKFFQKQQVFWCSVSLEETFGSLQTTQHLYIKRKKIFFYFVKKE